MSSWDDFGSTYVESITSALPLHRLAIFTLGGTISAVVSNQTHLSIAETILAIKLFYFIDKDSGLPQEITILNLTIGLLAIFFSWLISRLLVRAGFFLASRGTKLPEREAYAIQCSKEIMSMNSKEKNVEINILEKSLEKPSIRMKKTNALCEILCGIFLSFMFAFIWGNILDFIISFIAFIGAVVTSLASIRLFFREYYGPALFISQLQGRRPPSPP